MLSHLHRFHGHGSLRYAYRNGAQSRNRSLSLKFIKNDKRIHTRIAIVVSKKIYKSAVKRNRIRRRIYGVLGTEFTRIQKPYDIVITVFNPELLTMPYEDLRKEVLSLLEKESLIS